MIISSFVDRTVISDLVAKMLLEVGAFEIRTDSPFRLTSGWASPVYIDCRKVISYPRVRQTMIDFAASVILREIGFESIDTIAGGESAGIPFAAWIADRLMLPMQYVRKQNKGFGREAQIEGELIAGSRILLVEDLTTDGRSKMHFCQALRSASAIVDHTFVVFYYDIFPCTDKRLESIGLKMHALATCWDVLRVAKLSNRYDTVSLDQIEKFFHDPISWSIQHGGAGTIS